jgi:hypothetical protein
VNEIRSAFLSCARISADLVRLPVVGERWDRPSALEQFSTRGLAGHLVRATGSVEAYLDRPEPEGPPIGAAEYYAAAVDATDLQSELHVAIRARGEAEAEDGHAPLVEKLDALTVRLERRLATEPAGRRLRVFKDLVLTLDDYLVTRLIEQIVHCDDLAVSVGVETPEPPPRAAELAIDALVGVARFRHGDLAVLRALTRRERDDVAAMRIL